MTKAQCLAVAALILCGNFALPAVAQNAPAAGQEPPPVADPGTTSQYNCISDEGKYIGHGKSVVYRIELTNKCEQRLKCRVFAYTISSKGPAHGNTTLILAPKSRGAAATQAYPLKVKAVGGLATVSRECRVF
jgi:hypothetical protein